MLCLKTLRLMLLFSFGLIPATGALALPEDRGKPVQVTADQMQWQHQQQIGIYQGQVVVIQGELRLEADRLTLHRGADGQLSRASAEADEKLVYMRDLPELDQPEVEAWARHIDYHPSEETLILTGQAHLRQGEDHFRGHRLVYHLTSQDLQAEQDTGGEGRIEVILTPQRSTGN